MTTPSSQPYPPVRPHPGMSLNAKELANQVEDAALNLQDPDLRYKTCDQLTHESIKAAVWSCQEAERALDKWVASGRPTGIRDNYLLDLARSASAKASADCSHAARAAIFAATAQAAHPTLDPLALAKHLSQAAYYTRQAAFFATRLTPQL